MSGRTPGEAPPVYTKTGDGGTTGRLFGGRVSKADPVIETCGTSLRRAERELIAAHKTGLIVSRALLAYVNRASDLAYAIARLIVVSPGSGPRRGNRLTTTRLLGGARADGYPSTLAAAPIPRSSIMQPASSGS